MEYSSTWGVKREEDIVHWTHLIEHLFYCQGISS